MKFLVICNSASGLHNFRSMLLKELIKKGDQIVAIVPESTDDSQIGSENELKKLGCQLIRMKIERRNIALKKDLFLLAGYARCMFYFKPEFVITYTIKPNIYGGVICRLLKIPYAVNVTGLGSAFQKKNFLYKIVVLLYKLALKNAKTVFFENQNNFQIFLNERIIESSQGYLLNGAGVDLDKFSYHNYPQPHRGTNFLFIGRIMKEKGVEELFFAMKRLQKDNQECHLYIVGNFEENYCEVIEKYEKEGWLTNCGHQKDVRPFIARADCFVLPSWHEGMSNTNLENAAMGRPVITSNISGCKEAVIDGVSGMLCEPGDEEEVYNAMKKFLDLTYEERKTMGIEGRKHMEKNFDKKEIVKKTISRLDMITS